MNDFLEHQNLFIMIRILIIVLSFLMLNTSSYTQSTEQKMQSAIDSIFKANEMASGIMVHVEAPDQSISWSGATGYADKKTKQKLEADQPALIASSIKTYVSATILRLVEEGMITLDTSIADLVRPHTLKIFTKAGYNFEQILIKHLLSHTSGIQNYANEQYIDFKANNPQYRWSRDEQLALSVDMGLPLSEPGKGFQYADANYLLLTEIIEQLYHLPFYTAMKKLLRYEELGLKHTWFPTLEETPANTKSMAHQYWSSKGWDATEMDISWDLYGGGGIATTTRELALFVQHYFNERIVKNDSIKELIFTEVKTKVTEEFPYYMGLSRGTYHDMHGYGHGGFWGTVMHYFPDINASVAVYTLDRDQRAVGSDVMDAMIKELTEVNK